MPAPGDARRERLARARLYVVTGARQAEGDLPEFLDAVLGAGADIVQLREKEAEAGDLLRWSGVFRAAADRHGALFVVNDRPDVALAAGADGVHLGQNDLPATWARRVVGPDLLIGLSTHAPAEFDAARLRGRLPLRRPGVRDAHQGGASRDRARVCPACGGAGARRVGAAALVRDRRHRSADASGRRSRPVRRGSRWCARSPARAIRPPLSGASWPR